MAVKTLHAKMRKGVAIQQVSATQAVVCLLNVVSKPQVLSVPAPIKGVDVCAAWALIWTATDAHIFELGPDGLKSSVSFQIPAESQLVIHKEFVFQTDESTVKVLSHEGALKRLLLLDEPQGNALCLDYCDDYLALITSTAYIRMWRLDSADITGCGPGSRCNVTASSDTETPASLRCNCDGSKLSFTMKNSSSLASWLFIYDTALNKVFDYDFRSSDRMPLAHFWDFQDPKLLVRWILLVNACYQCVEGDEILLEEGTTEVVTLFATSDHGIVQHDKVDSDCRRFGLLGISIPFIYFYQRSGSISQDAKMSDYFETKTMRIFQEMDLDGRMQAVLLHFSLNLALGNTNEAYKAVECVQDTCIWENLARFCVKSRLLDPALYCLAKVGTGAGGGMATSICSSGNKADEEKLAALAIQLGLLNEAESLYIQCKRYDLLNFFYQMCGDWEKAIRVASKHDFVHLKSTHHAYAKHLEGLGCIKEAVKHYELSDTHRYEVPRMLFSLQLMEELEAYVNKGIDSALQQWWAHFCEANDSLSKAIEYYTSAGDIASVVRVYCYLNEFKAAAETASHFSDSSATFQLARQHEKNGNVHAAMQLFTKAGKSGYAAKLAMKHGIDSELLSLSLQSSKEIMVLSAKYFEEKGMHEEAVLLYQKGGNLERAIDVCVRSQLFDALKAIADDLDEGTNSALLSRCGDFLLSHDQTEKAVVLYIAAKQHDRALDLCIKEGVTITDRIADQFTSKAPEKDSEHYKHLVMQLAECCEAQGSYHLACKKYTQAGDRVKGMKALIRSGDTERIILFANASRQKHLYVLSANYLLTLDWHHDPTLMKTIVQMYTKAAEMDLLAGFYEACAQIEIDEFRDYKKALGAMKEALKYAMKSTKPQNDERMQSLQNRIAEIELFVQVRRMAKTDPGGFVCACIELLSQFPSNDNDAEGAAIRVGDVYALLVEFYFSQGNMEQAYHTLEKMKGRQILVDPYVDQHIIDAIYQAIGMDSTEENNG